MEYILHNKNVSYIIFMEELYTTFYSNNETFPNLTL